MLATTHDLFISSSPPTTQYKMLTLIFEGRYTWVYRSKAEGPEDKWRGWPTTLLGHVAQMEDVRKEDEF